MLEEIKKVLRLVNILGRQRQKCGLKAAGGLLVLLWTETGASSPNLNCTVAGAGSWCRGINMEALQPVLTEVQESMFPCVLPCPQPDPEELCAFTDLYGSLRLLLSFQIKDARLFTPEWFTHIEAFLHTFALINAGIKIHLKYKFPQQTYQREFRGKIKRKVAQTNQTSLILDVTCSTPPPECVKTGCWCQGGHPVPGVRLPLRLPPEVMDQGLFGELSIQFVTLLRPCVLQYPNLATQLTHIQFHCALNSFRLSVKAEMKVKTVKSATMRFCQKAVDVSLRIRSDPVFHVQELVCRGISWLRVLVCSPTNIPVTGPSTFLQNLPAYLDHEDLGLHGLRSSSFEALLHSSGTVYAVERENCEDPDRETKLPQMQQSLLLLLFLQHSDPFTYHLCDVMATEALIEHHLEGILSNNRQAVTAAVQSELKNTLKAQNRRKKDQEKLHSAAEVIVSSSISIVSCSSNVDFRNACLNIMKVRDTHELSASLRESLRRVTSWKFIPKGRCYSAQMEEHPESEDPTRTEI